MSADNCKEVIVRRQIEELKLDQGFWYLATPYTKWWAGLDDAAQQAAIVAGGLTKRGLTVYSPIVNTHIIGLACNLDMRDAEMWLAAERPMAACAHGILVANMLGWDKSYGVGKEREWFYLASKPSYLIDVDAWTAEGLAYAVQLSANGGSDVLVAENQERSRCGNRG